MHTSQFEVHPIPTLLQLYLYPVGLGPVPYLFTNQGIDLGQRF